MNYDIEAIIAAAGGIEPLSDALGMHPRRGYNLVSMWRHRRSIPPSAILRHQPLFDKLMKKAAKMAIAGA